MYYGEYYIIYYNQETLEKVQDWMKKYDKDMEGIDLKIQLKKNDYDQTYDRRLELENTVNIVKKFLSLHKQR